MQQALVPGTVIDKRYRIQNKLTDTTSNQCYLAEDTDQSNRLVIISFPKLELQLLPGFNSAFEDACQRLIKARLNGLIKILNHGEYQSQPYSVAQYVTHGTLASTLASLRGKQKKSPMDDVLDWARPLAVILDELHDLGYVHTNVCPTTIFLGQNRQILLGDFITEYAVQQLGAFKQAISSLDIPNYLAPEYIKSRYDKHYDQYLLATIIYEALAGRSHFHNPGSAEAYRRQVATKFPEPLLTQRPELIGPSRILSKALERNPAKRFDSCRDFVNQLDSTKTSRTSNDKPVTVIKKVLELDETAPIEPIATSTRQNRGSGSKKLVWLGILLLGTGAGVYALNHFGGLGQLQAQLSAVFGDKPNTAEAPLAAIPENSVVKTQKETSVASQASVASKVVQRYATSQNTSATAVIADQRNTKTISIDKPVLPEVVVALEADTAEKKETDSAPKALTPSPVVSKVGAEAMKKIINQTLAEGQAEFIKNKSESAPSVDPSEVSTINEAISVVLQEAEVGFMRKSSPAASTSDDEGEPFSIDDSLASDKESESSSSQVLGGSKPSKEVLAAPGQEEGVEKEVAGIESSEAEATNDQSGDGVMQNTPLSASEVASQSLQEQMIAANKLADEERNKQQKDAQKRAADAKKEAETRKVASEPTPKVFEDMQKERARIQAIKAQKIAHRNGVTKDCMASGNIHRQAQAGNLRYVKNCLSVGVSPNLAQSNRWTLLHLASQGGYLNMAKLLIAKGADVNAKASNGKTPLDMANEKKQDRMISFLRKRGGTPTR